MSGNKDGAEKSGDRKCLRCNLMMSPGKVTISYMGSTFPVDLLKCQQCGQVFIPEDLVMGKMLEVEKTLEDK